MSCIPCAAVLILLCLLQHECAIFNEREKLYDEISDLYRNYQDSVSSDLDGSKIEDFWRHMARVCLKMIGGLRDCNISWFADLIMRMLLHYGTNIATHSALVPSQHIIKPSAGGLDQSSIVKPSIASTDSKQRLLEARMGTGGIGQTNSFGRGPNRVIRPSSSSSSSATTQINRNASDAMHTSSNRVSNQPQLSPAVNLSNSALLSQPTVLFPGNQQFFFRFFIQCDSYRLCQYLNILMWAELESITEQALHNLSIGDSFTLCLYKLSILGRFLGLLHFSPHWILSVPKDSLDSGPLRNLAERISDVRKNRFISHVSGKVNLLDIVQTSMREKRLCLTIPWVAEFLKLMAWDGTIVACASTSTVTKTANLTIGGNASGGVHQEIACVQYLVTLLFADRQILEKETMSSNR